MSKEGARIMDKERETVSAGEGTVFYAKSPLPNGRHPTVAEHCDRVAEVAAAYGDAFGCAAEARLAGQFHDFGKYGARFQDVLKGLQRHVDHAICGATFLYAALGSTPSGKRSAPVLEAINGHHDGLLEMAALKQRLIENARCDTPIENHARKFSGLAGKAEYQSACTQFRRDHPGFVLPRLRAAYENGQTNVERMLYTRMLFSCLVDADYSVSASDERPDYFEETEMNFDPAAVLQELYAYQASLGRGSSAKEEVNRLRQELFQRCGEAGDRAENGLFTLTAPTGTGKTLALLHFALRHCAASGKRRIIIVLPYLSITQQNAAVYRQIYPGVLEDHSQSHLTDEAREFAARWSAPLIVTTSVRFFETLFADQPADCRKLHHIADSVVVFDEAQSLPADVSTATLKAVKELCRRYRTTMLFSTATQPDYDALREIDWKPEEILPNSADFYAALRRTRVEWRIEGRERIPLQQIAEEMAAENSVCAIVNLRRHAKVLFEQLRAVVPEEELFFMTTDLCPADREQILQTIQGRLAAHKPCRLVATQCVEAGGDFDFDVIYRALAPLDAIIQAAGRCNRNGRLADGGRVVVFVPDEPGRLYPGDWYEQAAQKTEDLAHRHAIDIDDAAHIREYYQLLLEDAKDKPALREALEEGSYAKVAQAYHLIENEGVRLIVPSPTALETYRAVREQALTEGMSPALMKQAAGITVSIFPKKAEQLAGYIEMLPYARRGREPAELSGFCLLRPQYEALYTARTGMQFPSKEEENLLY